MKRYAVLVRLSLTARQIIEGQYEDRPDYGSTTKGQHQPLACAEPGHSPVPCAAAGGFPLPPESQPGLANR